MSEKLEEIKKIAIQRGGRCISDTYLNNTSALTFKCRNNHEWNTNWKNINKGSWCPVCSVKKGNDHHNFLNIQDMSALAKVRGGECLSVTYKGAHSKLEWKCKFGHKWIAKPNNIKNGTWCPICSSGTGERMCKLFFEKLFNKKFVKCRPDFLKIGKINIELDGFCEELKIAFEYNGKHHYEEFESRTLFPKSKYDTEKIQLCQQNNIKLFIIPESINRINLDYIKNVVLQQSKEIGVELPNNFHQLLINDNDIYQTSKNSELLKELQQISTDNNGKCLSNNYIRNNVKLDFFCNVCEYIWQATPNAIKNGTWCPKCAHKRITIQNAIDLALAKNGKCLSVTYNNSTEKMLWECSFLHQWKASYNQIQSGDWCPACYKKIRGKSRILKIDVYKNVAKNKGGECLSTNIMSCYDKLQWRCKNEHTWYARADSIKNTHKWCPVCSRQKR